VSAKFDEEFLRGMQVAIPKVSILIKKRDNKSRNPVVP